jgi:uroporphyrin-III C-methyltransferase
LRERKRNLLECSVQPGKVYLVGAGPGHPELLTIKAAKLLETSDVVVYDRLIQEEILAMAKPSAEKIYMGKTVGLHESRQDEIHHLLAQKAREGKTVVRLKGGDPFLFGRGGEEAEFLADAGIPFEVVPGVSSALAAPASAGIAVTHRDAASAIAIVTGHEAARDESRLNWDALAGMDTLVFLMAVHSVGNIADELMARGRDPATPAAMIQMAFWHGERVVTGTLATIGADVAAAGIAPPATLVIGEVVRLREKLQHSARDLCRRADGSSRFVPAPTPDQLLRMATAGIGSQVLRFALAASLFDYLEQWLTAQELARTLGVNTHGLAEVLESLVSMGLLESGAGGYRNLELASRYLVEGSPQSLRPALLRESGNLATLGAVGRYVLNGREDGAPRENHELQREACECMARYSAGFVLEQLDLAGTSPVLLIGWGGEVYREAARSRWPDLVLECRNPFGNGHPAAPATAIAASGGPFGAVLLSGLLANCERDQFRPALAQAAGVLRPKGVLILHDSFLPSDTLPPAEMVLSALGRHVIQGGARNWPVARLQAELLSLGLDVVQKQPVPGGTQLVVATRL